jgi:hypothetical protein
MVPLLVMLVAQVASGQSLLELVASHPTEIVQYEPLFVSIRVRNVSQERLVIHDDEYRSTLRLEARSSPKDEWEAEWRPEFDARELTRGEPPLRFPTGAVYLNPGSSVTWAQWIHWRQPLEFGGRPFVFHDEWEGQLRFTMSIKAAIEVLGQSTFEVSTDPIAFKVKAPSEEDWKALRWATHSEFVSMAGYNKFPVSAIAQRLSDDSSLKDFFCFVAGCYHLSKVSKYDEHNQNNGDLDTARWASKFFSRISDRNHRLRESGAMRLLLTHKQKPQVRKAIDLSFVRKNLQAAEFLATDLFQFGTNPRQRFARYLHEQELLAHKDDRLDKEYLLPNIESEEAFEDYIQRIVSLTNLPLDLTAYPDEFRKQTYPGNPLGMHTIRLRDLLWTFKRDDWYWVPSEKGYALEYREPRF